MFSPNHCSASGRNIINLTGDNRPFHLYACLLSLLLIFAPLPGFAQIGQNPLTRLQQHYPADDIISLSGIWDITLPDGSSSTLHVPGFYVRDRKEGKFNFPNEDGPFWRVLENQPEITYHKTFDVPGHWAEKRQILRIESANFMVRVYLNGVKVGQHVGGYLPFEIDLTPYLSAPSTGNHLKIAMVYNDWAVMDHLGYLAWPTGYYGAAFNLGLTGEVSLLARPSCHVLSQQIHTEIESRSVSIDTRVANPANQSITGQLISVIDETGQILDQRPFTVAAAETAHVQIHSNMPGAKLWSPQAPHLYTLSTRFEADGQAHTRRQRFGFQSFTMEGDHFLLNGVRINLRGDNIVLESESTHFPHYWADYDAWTAIVDSMKALNFNVIRFHQQPAPPWMLDVCDEKGLMVIPESAIFDDFLPRSDKYVANTKLWLKDWVHRDRNHPSIIMWSVWNEILAYSSQKFFVSQVRQWKEAVHEVDPNRLQLYEGDGYSQGLTEIASWHYPWGYPNFWDNVSLYDTFVRMNNVMEATTGERLDLEKPISIGEFEWIAKGDIHPQFERRQAIKVRAFRILGVDDIRPYRLDWSWYPQALTINPYDGHISHQDDIEFLRESMAPVAAFDKDYYAVHWAPALPEAEEGSRLNRTVAVFNDTRSDPQVTLRWRTWTDGTIHDEGVVNLAIPPGEMRETLLDIPVPYVTANRTFHIELATEKSGETLFSERTPFRALDTGKGHPQSIPSLSIDKNGNRFRLSWTPVTQNVEGLETDIAHYVVTRASHPDFSESAIEQVSTVTGTTFEEDVSQHLAQSRGTAFYRVYAVDTEGLRAAPSPIYGFSNTPITVQHGDHFHHVPLLFEPERSADRLLQLIPGATDIVQWDAATQAFRPYNNATDNFMVQAGGTFFIQTAQSTVWTQFGKLAQTASTFHAASPTSAHTLTVPLARKGPIQAAQLMHEIEGSDAVALWDEINQGFQQYIPRIPNSAFQIQAGEACFIHTPSASAWTPSTAKNNTLPAPSTTLAGHAIFHTAAAMVRHTTGGFPDQVTFTAHIIGRESEVLTESSPGCGYDAETGYCYVQCAHFTTPWQAGDRLLLKLNMGAGLAGETVIMLNAASAVNFGSEIVLNPPLREITLHSVPEGLTLVVDGAAYITPYETQWAHGSQHRLVASRMIDVSEVSRHRFMHWNTSAEDTLNLVVGSEDIDLVATYQSEHYVEIASPYGTVSGSGWYTAGSDVTFSLSPTFIGDAQNRQTFTGWTGVGDNAYTGEESSTTLRVNGPVLQTAQWLTEHYLSLSLTPEDGGQVSPPPPGLWAAHGADVVLTATPEMGHQFLFVAWQGDRYSQNNPFTVSMDSALSVTAHFQNSDEKPPQWTALYPTPGALAVPVNAPVSLSVTDPAPGSGIALERLSVNCNEIPMITNGAPTPPYTVSWTDSLFSLSLKGRLNAESEALVLFQLSAGDQGTPSNIGDSTYAIQTGTSRLEAVTPWQVDDQGGDFSLDEQHASCQIPAAVLSQSTSLYTASVTEVPAMPENCRQTGSVTYWGPDGIQLPDSVTLKIPYTQAMLNTAQIAHVSELKIYRYNTVTAGWTTMHVDRLTSDHLYVKTVELGLFTAAGTVNTAVDDALSPTDTWQLSPCYPNPFNGQTVITVNVPAPAQPATITIYDCTGRKVIALLDEGVIPAGSQRFMWQGNDEQGNQVASGMYLVVLMAGRIRITQKVLYLR